LRATVIAAQQQQITRESHDADTYSNVHRIPLWAVARLGGPSGLFHHLSPCRYHGPLRRIGPCDAKTRPPADRAPGSGTRRTQQPQPAGWATDARRDGAALGTGAPSATRRPAWPPPMAGALMNARVAPAPHSGQAHGSRNCAIGRMAVNGPQTSQA
jgi:hypothetical protein